jgi:hypothetical protein
MVYMGVKVTTYDKMYDDGVKASAVASIFIDEPLQMDSDVLLM